MNSSHSNWVVVIQARTGSTRLPNKMLLPFHDGKTIFEIVIETLLSVFPKDKIVLATTVNPKDDTLANIAERFGIAAYRGSEEDVLSRFIDVVEKFNLDAVLRICADNPFFIRENLKEIAAHGEKSDADYLAYFFKDNLPTIRSHSGFFGEWVSAEALKEAACRTQDKFYHEHVTNFIYGNEDIFKIEKLQMPEEDFCRSVRLTIDTEEDFNMAQEIYSMFENKNEITIAKLKTIVANHPEYLQKMQRIISQYAK